jgi:hypothetical protein
VVFSNVRSCFSWNSSADLTLLWLYVGLGVCDVRLPVLFLSSRGLPLCGVCVVCMNGCVEFHIVTVYIYIDLRLLTLLRYRTDLFILPYNHYMSTVGV